MDNHDIDAHPDLQDLRQEPGFDLRTRWRNRKRLTTQSREPDIQRRQRRRTWLKAGSMVLVPIAAIAVLTYWPEISGAAGDPHNRIPPSTTPTNQQPLATVRLDQPFVGTPAAGWKDGLAGIRFPKPKTTGHFSADDVADALSAVRESLHAAYLDPRVIVEHDLDVYVDTLAPAVRPYVADEGAAWVVRIHPDYPLLPASPKTNGKVSVHAGESGELIIDARFAVAYAFDIDDPADVRRALDIVALRSTRDSYRFYAGPEWENVMHGVHPADREGFLYSMNCEAAADGLLAPSYSDERPTAGEDGQRPHEAFDPDAQMGGSNTCPQAI